MEDGRVDVEKRAEKKRRAKRVRKLTEVPGGRPSSNQRTSRTWMLADGQSRNGIGVRPN